jgi:hypothetical protein
MAKQRILFVPRANINEFDFILLIAGKNCHILKRNISLPTLRQGSKSKTWLGTKIRVRVRPSLACASAE